MTAAEIGIVEHEVGFKLPVGYLEFIARYPALLKELYYDFGTWREYVCESVFIIGADRLVKVNRDFRAQLQINDQPLNPEFQGYLAIGYDPGRNFYTIDSNGFPAVCFYAMEDGWMFEIEPNLDSFARSAEKSWEEWPHAKGRELRI